MRLSSSCIPRRIQHGVGERLLRFKFSRDAELEIETSINESLIEKMASSLKQRRKADAVRFVYDATMPEMLLEQLRKRLGFGRYDSLIPGGRYHNSKDYIGFLMQDPSI